MVTAGCYLLIRISPIQEYSSTSLMIIIWLGSLGALFGAACGMVDNDLKRVIAMSTNSQQGYMIVAIGISQYNLGLFHLLTHAFFVRRDRKYYPLQRPSLGKKFKKYELTYIYFKFEFSLQYKRLTRVNPWQNCVIVLKISHFRVKNTQEKVFIGLHIVNERKIVGILIILKSLDLNVIFLKHGKLGQLKKNIKMKYLKRFCVINIYRDLTNFFSFLVNGCRIFTKHNAPINRVDRFEEQNHIPISTSSRECRIKYSLNKSIFRRGFHTTSVIQGKKPSPHIKLLFKKELSNLQAPHLNKLKAHEKLVYFIKKWLNIFIVMDGCIDDKTLIFMSNMIHQRCWIWAETKHHKVSKSKIFDLYFNSHISSDDTPIFYNINKFIRLTYVQLKSSNLIKLPLAKPNLFFTNIGDPKIKAQIKKELSNLVGPCIYIFFNSLNPKICYLGSTINPALRFSQHVTNYSNSNRGRHPKFYNNALHQHGLEFMNFQILANCSAILPNELQDLEQYWQDTLFAAYGDQFVLNILKFANSTTGRPASETTKLKMSKAHKGKTQSEYHRLAISWGKKGYQHHLYGTKRDESITKKQSLSMQKFYAINGSPLKGIKLSENHKAKQSKAQQLQDESGIIVKELEGIRIAMEELKIGHSTMKRYLTTGEYFKLQDGNLVKLVYKKDMPQQ